MAEPSGRRALSFVQRGMWFFGQLAPGNPFYNLPCVYRLAGDLDVAALSSALAAVVARHEVLRTRFVTEDGEPWLETIAPYPVTLVPEDIARAADPVAEAHRLAAHEVLVPVDLAEGRMLRARLLRLRDADHVLILVVHHAASDGWSLGVLRRELDALYRSFSAGKPSPLPPLEVQYSDFAEWQRSMLADGERRADWLEYWRERLRGMPDALELPTDYPRPPIATYSAGSVPFEVPAATVRLLRSLGARRRATLFIVMLAAFDALLAGYTGGTDIVVGVPAAGRYKAKWEGLIGCFVNNLAVRVDCSGDPAFGDLVERARDAVLGAFDHQDLPFEWLVQELNPVRDPSRNPLVQVGFQILAEEHTGRVLTLEGLRVEHFEGHDDTVHLDVEVFCWPAAHGICGRVIYPTELFERPTMERFADAFVRVLKQVTTGGRLSELSLLSPDARREQLADWNDTWHEVPSATVASIFEAQVARTPRAVAVSGSFGSVTYAELNARANRFARRLASLGAGPEVVVGLCAGRGLDVLVGMLAIVKAGAAYLPLDPDYPAERIALMIEDAACELAIVEDGLAIDLRGAGVVRFNPVADAAWPDRDLAVKVSPANLACVIYTSGSTGRPKGVQVIHQGLTNVIAFQSETFGLGPRSRVLQVASICFDASASEIWITWVRGGELVILPRQAMTVPWTDVLAEREITQLAAVPSVLASLPQASLPRLGTIIIGGEAGAPAVVNRWAHGRRLFNVYGPTETTINATFSQYSGKIEAPLPIGRPVWNTQTYVLDAWLRPVPVGVPGEVYLGGAGVSRGYLGQPALTSSRYIANPFGQGTRLYRTGDLARFLPDGSLEFVRRVDDQVKLRGFRVELGEVEATIARHPSVGQVSVAVREDSQGDRRIFAYVVPSDSALTGESPADGQLSREHVRDCQRWFDQHWRESGEPEPASMAVNPTVLARFAAHRPKRVLEIGCGAGALVRRLSGDCDRYVATDFSSAAVDTLRVAPDLADRPGVTVLTREATDFRGFRERSFDAVIVDSVTQHCPTLSYVEQIIDGALAALRDDGFLIVADVHSAAERGSAGPDESLGIDAGYFSALPHRLPRAASVELVHDGDRFDVVITAGQSPSARIPAPRAAPPGVTSDPLRARRTGLVSRQLRQHCRERMPEFMVPSAVVILDRMPLSPNGKADVRHLPVPEATSFGRPPDGPAEEALCALFSEVLSRGAVSPDDGFFDLGGHSLLALRVLNRIKSRLGADISLGEFLLSPTPSALARLIAHSTEGGNDAVSSLVTDGLDPS
ncbi:MAG TPA: amino acid adenylation domain-containing protein [Streptosporangiaceae bacterium]|nr:amino acid adenylation domain-containing protein [Streptosporangiaceae bacterium]